MKYRASSMSPRWTRVSPGGTWVVLNFIDNARKHPGLAPDREWTPSVPHRVVSHGSARQSSIINFRFLPLKAGQLCKRFLLRCKQMSAWRHSGNPFNTWRKEERKLNKPVTKETFEKTPISIASSTNLRVTNAWTPSRFLLIPGQSQRKTTTSAIYHIVSFTKSCNT